MRARVWGTVADLRVTTTFMRQADVNADELQTLVRTWFLSADGVGHVELTIPAGADPCDFDQWRLSELTDQVLDQIHRFLRLQRRLGWTLNVLDGLLRALGRNTIEFETLTLLARAHHVAREFGRPIAELTNARRYTPASLDRAYRAEAASLCASTAIPCGLSRQQILLERWLGSVPAARTRLRTLGRTRSLRCSPDPEKN
ncbi:MAG: hypothetical protein IPM58_04645 [Nitrospira sp.]|nr:hypothetical protein [Nitrospira sp.]